MTFGEKRIIKTITLILLILNLNPFSLLFFALFGTRISATQDVANYGNYESYADKIEEIMPKEITDDMVKPHNLRLLPYLLAKSKVLFKFCVKMAKIYFFKDIKEEV